MLFVVYKWMNYQQKNRPREEPGAGPLRFVVRQAFHNPVHTPTSDTLTGRFLLVILLYRKFETWLIQKRKL
jgi:hypothetical protein